MQRINLRSVDLNLLVVFDAVMAERSVTRAAGRLRLTQPAVSHALSRLRGVFKDPLFVRTPAGLEPTPAAARLAGRIGAVLNDIGAILTPDEDFAPATSARRFTIGMSDYAAFVFLPSLARRLQTVAPSMQLIARNTNHAEGIGLLGEVRSRVDCRKLSQATQSDRERIALQGRICVCRPERSSRLGPSPRSFNLPGPGTSQRFAAW